MNYDDREKLKQEAWHLYTSTNDINIKAVAIEMTIEAHYWRSLETTKRHPDYETYAAHYISANANKSQFILWAENSDEEKEVVGLLFQKFGRVKYPKIAPGSSYWNTSKEKNVISVAKVAQKDKQHEIHDFKITAMKYKIATLELELLQLKLKHNEEVL